MRLAVAILALGACLAFGGCSSVSSSSTPPLNAPSAGHKRDSLVYVSDSANSFIGVFDRNGTPTGTITQGLKYPSGLFVDRAGNLWVANAGHSNVLEFARGGTSPIATLADGNAYTQDVTVCPNGDVFVATLLGGVTKYVGRRHRIAGSLTYGGGQFQFVTCDSSGNVFATGVAGTNGTVFEFPHGRNAGARLLPISSPGNLGGIKADLAGNIIVVNGKTIAEYTEGGSPTGNQIVTTDGWLDIALTRNGKVLLGSDQAAKDAVSVTFPGNIPRVTYADGFNTVWGVAYDDRSTP